MSHFSIQFSRKWTVINFWKWSAIFIFGVEMYCHLSGIGGQLEMDCISRMTLTDWPFLYLETNKRFWKWQVVTGSAISSYFPSRLPFPEMAIGHFFNQ